MGMKNMENLILNTKNRINDFVNLFKLFFDMIINVYITYIWRLFSEGDSMILTFHVLQQAF